MRSLMQSYLKILEPIARKNGFINARLMSNWSNIIGEEFAQFCRPVRLYYRKNSGNKGILTLKVNSSHALLVMHSKDLIIDKINSYLNNNIIGDIKIIQNNVKLP